MDGCLSSSQSKPSHFINSWSQVSNLEPAYIPDQWSLIFWTALITAILIKKSTVKIIIINHNDNPFHSVWCIREKKFISLKYKNMIHSFIN